MNSVNRMRMAILVFLVTAVVARTPVFAQSPGIDFSGEWTNWVQDGEGDPRHEEVGDVVDVPYNQVGLRAAETFNLGLWGQPEYECRPHPGQFFWRGTGQNRISKVVDVVSRETTAFRVERRRNHDVLVYMDGRPHPPEDGAHYWGGFSTGKWIGNMLEVTTTHLKQGYLGMNGIPASDQATVKEYWIRHGDYLFIFETLYDPIYLEEPFTASQVFRLDLEARLPPSPCIPVEESTLDRGTIPHWMPGENPFWFGFVDDHNIPRQVLKDGAEKNYPEYQAKIKQYRAQPQPK